MPKKRFGQHFLSDPHILDRIAGFSKVGSEDTVVEIGPGKGTLTGVLAARVRRVIAIEIDRELAVPLRRRVGGNVEVLEGDALRFDYTRISSEPYHVVANLPYNVATALIEMFLEARESILAVTVTVQKEVADRILAEPGSRAWGALSVGVQYRAAVEGGPIIRPGAFTPPPKVQSQLIRLVWREGVRDSPELMALVRCAFRSRRKKLVNNLIAAEFGVPNLGRSGWIALLEAQGIDPDARAEDLSVDDFIRILGDIGL